MIAIDATTDDDASAAAAVAGSGASSLNTPMPSIIECLLVSVLPVMVVVVV